MPNGDSVDSDITVYSIDSINQIDSPIESPDQQDAVENSNPIIKLDRNGNIVATNRAGQLLLQNWGLTVNKNLNEIQTTNHTLLQFQDTSFEVWTRQISKTLRIKIGKTPYVFFFMPIKSLGQIYIHGVKVAIKRQGTKTSWKQESDRKLFNQIFDGILIIESQTGTIIDCNRSAAELMGLSTAEIVGKHHSFIHPPEGFPFIKSSLQNQLNGEELFESQLKARKGENKFILSKAYSVKAKGKKIVQLIFRDITCEKKMEQNFMKITLFKLPDISRGGCFIFQSHEKCFKAYNQLTKFGIPGLCIIREDPQKIVSEYGIKQDQIRIIASKNLGNYEVLPSLQSVSLAVSNALKANPICVIILDGLEYLISRSGFQSVYSFIQERRFDFIQSEALLLMPINLEALDEKEKALLTSEAKIIDP